MITSIQKANAFGFGTYFPAIVSSGIGHNRDVYEQNRRRIYALAFWMTDNELVAEELMIRTFCRAFANNNNNNDDEFSAEQIDGFLVSELREQMALGTLTLNCSSCEKVLSVRYNVLRVDLERAVIQLPSTEKIIFLMHDVESYDHSRIARILGLSEDQSRQGLHQARLRLRQLLAK